MNEVVEFIKNFPWWLWVLIALVLIAVYDIFINKKHTILHNFPLVGHLRYLLESIGPSAKLGFLPKAVMEINLGDRFIAKTLAKTFTYNKTKVPFDSVATLVGCPNLGGSYRKGQETDVKEVETEDTSVSEQ